MSSTPELLQSAVTLHQNGDFAQARVLYEQVLAREPNNDGVLNLMGLALRQAGNHDEAVDFLQRAIALNRTQAAYFANLGEAYRGLEKLNEAIEQYTIARALAPDAFETNFYLASLYEQSGDLDKALTGYQRSAQIRPTSGPCQFQLAHLLHEQGKLHPASLHYEQALRIDSSDIRAWTGLARVRKEQGELVEARDNYLRVLKLRPDAAWAHFELGNVYQVERSWVEAIACFREAVRLSPEYFKAIVNLGNALREHHQLDEALEWLERAVTLRDDYAAAHSNLGAVLQDQYRYDEAQRAFERAIELEPDKVQFHFNLGNVLKDQGRIAEAAAAYDTALRIAPDFSQAICSRASVSLATGDFAAGWAGYEERINCPQINTRKLRKPRWNGERLTDAQLLIHCEQGFGDTLQFIRYAKLAAERAPNIVVAVQTPLVPLLTQSGIPGVVSEENDPAGFDVHAPLMSLPHIFGTTLETVPRDVPYIKAEPTNIDRWRAELAHHSGFRVGIVWQGRPDYRGDRMRSIPLGEFAPLAAVPSVRLLSLQKGPGVEQIAAEAGRFPLIDLGSQLDRDAAFVDTAAAMLSLDLVITSDTSTAHLAGALGVPVWVALSAAPEWRWMVSGDESPWYPTMRLFRQSTLGRWSDVFERMAGELDRRARS